MRIVVVDDAPVLRAVFAHIARSLGHCVVGEEADLDGALRAAAAARPDVIVLDGRLPAADVAAATASLLAVAPGAAIYVVAALRETNLVRAAVAAGAAGAIARPYNASRIAAQLRAR